MIFDTKPTVVGHRGFGSGESRGYRENTIDSYLAAVSHGLSWIELDVQRSRDDQLVIRHDPVTPDGDFLVTRTAEQLAFYGILRFEDVMAALPTGVAVNIDAKTIIEDATDPTHRRTAALLAEALRKHQERRRLFVSSFDPGLLMTLQDRKDTIEAYDYLVGRLRLFGPDGGVSDTAYEKMAEGLIELGDMKKPIPPKSAIFDASFVEQAVN
jgi:glycerophosphoryl diester phosphodiesterase